MKIVFLGTPSFALKPLIELNNSRHKIVAVVSQPDRAKGRKGNLLPTPVKELALSLNLPTHQFESIKNQIAFLKSLNADIFITVAYGQILSQEILNTPKFGVINAHASLLPKYRGASPIQSAILNGEKETGITIMQTELGLDSGNILSQEKIPILDSDTIETLFDKLSTLSADLLLKTLCKLENGNSFSVPQDHMLATKCSLITKEMGSLDFSKSARQVFNQIRAINSYSHIDGLYIRILDSEIINEHQINKDAGLIENDFIVKCGQGLLKIKQVLPMNKKRMTAKQFLLGNDVRGKKIGTN
ncbi:MAG: methionyl-tRNA formyltransferase [Firmicutes bacterium]|nr:methionyl-tRNA formyltransferase [Bacillota bacterium]